MEINVIHNEKRKDRFNLLAREMYQQNIESFRFWPAIYLGKPMEGIRTAHQNIVKDAKQRNLPLVCIGEDDMKFTSIGSWQYFLKNIPTDFDIYLASIYAGNLQPDNTCEWFAGLSLYIIRQSFYEKFLSVPTGKHIDRGLKNMGRFVVCNPFCCIQHETYSENQKKVLNNAKYLSGAKFYTGE